MAVISLNWSHFGLIDEIHMFMKARRYFVEPETDSKNRFQFFENAASCKNSYKDPELSVMFTLCLPNLSQMGANEHNQLHLGLKSCNAIDINMFGFFDPEKKLF